MERLKHILALYDEMLRLPHRAAIKREIREEEELFLMLCFSEAMGIPNPMTYYTLECYPLLLERFHAWHKRMGMERSPFDGIRCC